MERNTSASQQHIAAEAAEWFVRLNDPDEAPGLREEFTQWALRSPEHLEEFLAVSRVWGDAGQATSSKEALIAAALDEQQTDNVVALRSQAGELNPGRRSASVDAAQTSRRMLSWRVGKLAAAAALLLAVGVGTWLTVDRWIDLWPIRTAIGEQRSVTLGDGSVVDINTDSEVRVDLRGVERRLTLVRGEARFKVAKNSRRPFLVVTPQAIIHALGTVFNVRAEGHDTAVAVLEGEVELRRLTPEAPLDEVKQVELRAGQQAMVRPDGRILPNEGPPLERVAAWTERHLVFHNESLAVVVAEFNRYHRKPIRIESSDLAGLKVSGTFDSSDQSSLVEYFERYEHVRMAEDADAIRLSLPLQ